MNKIIFIMPPKDWFYGIDHINSERIVKYFEDNKIFNVYKFEDIEIFLKTKLEPKDYLKLIYYYFFFKIKKPKYVFGINASYVAYCNLILKKKILNFFSQILNIKCILRWDHINEQVPNIVENILKKYQFNGIDDYKIFFLDRIDNEKFNHFTWQKDGYFCNKNYLEDSLEIKNFKLKSLNFFFTSKETIKDTSFEINKNNKMIALIGYVNQVLKPDLDSEKLVFLLKDKKNFFDKKHYQNLVTYSNYVYSKNKMELMDIKDVNFYGINLIENSGRAVNSDDFYSEVSKFFLIINPVNPISLTITSKFYSIYLNGGFCINETPIEIPPKLEKFKKFIFYKDKKELSEKILFLKNNLSIYLLIKKEINEISKNLKTHSLKVFTDEFLNS